jgi:CBS domain containing-hemolysin-like protein
VTGYVTFKDIVSALAVNPTEPSLNAITRTILRLPESMNLATALETMIREKEHIALVVDSSAANVGLLTLEDIIEELVGQIGDEYDRPAMHVHKLPAGWIVGGGVSMGKICELLGVPAPEVVRAAPSMSLDDWCHHQRHGAVQNADLICADGLEIRVRKTRRQRVAEAVVRPLPPSPVAATARAEA